MHVDDAKARCKQLNQSKSIERKSAAKAARKAKWKQVIESVYLPERDVLAFAEKLEDDNFGSDSHKARLLSHWSTVQKLIKDIEVDPKDFNDKQKKIYHRFIEERWSLDYTNKLIRIFNMWGSFVCRRRGQHFEPIEYPTGQIREKIVEANEERTFYRGNRPSAPLTPELLKTAREKLSIKKGNWLAISFAFGLRPLEVDEAEFTTELDENGVTIVIVYQSKLVHLKREDRYKRIPVQVELQKEALKLWQLGGVERPKTTEIQSAVGPEYHLYAGRKGFEMWMSDLGETIDNISFYLGHRSLKRTLDHYKNKKITKYSIVKKNG
jgi:integrase